MMEVKRVVIKAELSKDYQKAGIEMEIEGEMDDQFYPQLNFLLEHSFEYYHYYFLHSTFLLYPRYM